MYEELKPWSMLGIYRHVNNHAFVNYCYVPVIIPQEQISKTSHVHLLSLFTSSCSQLQDKIDVGTQKCY